MTTDNIATPTESDLQWLGAVCDLWGGIKVEEKTKTPHLLLTFKTPNRDTLQQIQKAAGGLGYLTETPKAPKKNQVQPQFWLTFRGSHVLMLENLVLPFMRVERRRQIFADAREKLNDLRKHLGLTSPFRLPPPTCELQLQESQMATD